MIDSEKNQIQHYCEGLSSPEPSHLQELARYTRLNTTNPRMASGHLQGRFLSFISVMLQPKCILELGTFTGYSALCLAEGLTDNAVLHTIEANSENGFKAQKWIDKHDKASQICLHIGEAANVLPTLNIEADLVFVDADKANYPLYLDLCLKILKPNGVLLFDNTLWDGKVANEALRQSNTDTRRIHEFNLLLQSQSELEVVLIPLRDGLTMVRKKVSL